MNDFSSQLRIWLIYLIYLYLALCAFSLFAGMNVFHWTVGNYTLLLGVDCVIIELKHTIVFYRCIKNKSWHGINLI